MSFLLSYIASNIRTSTEDIATMSLHYILQNSRNATNALNLLVAERLCRQTVDGIFFEIQQCSDNDDSRPDMTAFNRHGEQVLIFEMKFEAVLTANQPNVYIERLRQDGGDALVFICPKQRLHSLCNDLLKISKYHRSEHNDCLLIKDALPLMLVLSWEEIMSILDKEIEGQYRGDLQQLKGLTSIMNRQDFKPFTTADISLDMAMRIVDYKEIVTKISDFLVFNGQCIKGILRKSERSEDKRRIYLFSKDEKYGLSIDYDLQRWISEGKKYHKTSPFWLRIKAINDKGDWVSCSQEHLAVLQDNNIDVILEKENSQKVLYCPLVPLINEEEYTVIEDLSQQVTKILEILGKSICQASMS